MTETVTKCRSHEWAPAENRHECTQCDAWCATCNVCARPTDTSLLVCQGCLDREAQVLTDIETALSHYQEQPRSVIPAIRYDKDYTHANGKGASSGDHVPLDLTEGPESVHGVMWDWVAAWTERSGDAQNLDAADYLRGHLMWAAHNAEAAGWDAYRSEMRTLRHTARRIAGLLPQRQEGRCIYCGSDVVRDWADEKGKPRMSGLSDEVRCTRCHMAWESPQHWRLANLHTIRELPSTTPEALVTRDDVKQIWPNVPAATWRTWVHRDTKRAEAREAWERMLDQGYEGPLPEPPRMPIQGWDTRGRALYRLADLTLHVDARQGVDTRRKAS